MPLHVQGRIASEITREELSECFNMPSEDAAKKLGVGLTVLKRICRKFGVPRWPFRKLKSLDRLITNVEVCGFVVCSWDERMHPHTHSSSSTYLCTPLQYGPNR